jgi:hypothetical protein
VAGEVVMWVLLWLHILNGELEYFHIDSFKTESACNAQKANAQVLIKNKSKRASPHQKQKLRRRLPTS